MVRGETILSDRPGCHAMTVRRPAGVVLGIAPWNAPVILGVRAVAAPLACGNTVVLKASEQCPATHRLIGDVFRDAGFPEGVVNVVLKSNYEGNTLRLKGQGMPVPRSEQRGDLFTEIQVVTPQIQDERSKELLRELGQINDASIRHGIWR